MDPRPAAGLAGCAAAVRGCPISLDRRSGPATGHARHRCGRGYRPPFCHDGTERRISRPKDADEQKSCYSGKKKCHTVKNILLINAVLTILFLSDTYEGSAHDKRIADMTRYPLPPGSQLMQDLGGFCRSPQKGAVGLKIGYSLRCSGRVPTTPRVCVIAQRCTVLAQNREDRLSMLV